MNACRAVTISGPRTSTHDSAFRPRRQHRRSMPHTDSSPVPCTRTRPTREAATPTHSGASSKRTRFSRTRIGDERTTRRETPGHESRRDQHRCTSVRYAAESEPSRDSAIDAQAPDTCSPTRPGCEHPCPARPATPAGAESHIVAPATARAKRLRDSTTVERSVDLVELDISMAELRQLDC